MYIVSKCLLGENCKYNGGNNYNENVVDFLKGKRYIKVCPEVAGGLCTPRVPAEIQGDKVINQEGEDVTLAFKEGAYKSFKACNFIAKRLKEDIEGAILKAKSPSCGKDLIYDGSFTHTLIEGSGIFTRLVIEKNIEVLTEKDIDNMYLERKYSREGEKK